MRISFFTLLLLLTTSLFGQSSKIHSELREGFLLHEQQEVIIVMQQQKVVKLPAVQGFLTKREKGRLVYRELTTLAGRSQARLHQYLQAEGVTFRGFNVVNALHTTLTEAQALAVSRFPNVRQLISNPWVKQDLGWPERPSGQARQSIEWGVEKIKAPELWSLGHKGNGAVVGGQDTGYDFRHPALVNQYRGTGGTDTIHDYNWHDAIRVISPLNNNDNNPCGLDVPEPCDDNNHGTHTMGTMVGDDGAGNQIGVAPEAKWVACRNMERGWGSPASYIECFEWFLAPTRVDGTAPNPDMAPDVIANSWSCPEVEGCVTENFELMEIAINNLRAAGTMVVVSAGNDGGQGCSSITKPPSIFTGAFAVGATDSRDTIAGFSSRGPVFDSSGFLQPQVVAPGVSVRSSIRNGQYGNSSGTSMSGPHVAGAVALLISAVPELAGNVDGLERIFRESATPLFSAQDCGTFPGDAHPNAVYGYGRIDLNAAFLLAQTLVSTQEYLQDDRVKVFPNPTSDQLNLITPSELVMERIELLDFTGASLLQSSQPRLNISQVPSGIYLLRIETPEGSIIKKVVKQ
ncbi:MAG: S8 family serine peptidase [Bacteroidota bacterium]